MREPGENGTVWFILLGVDGVKLPPFEMHQPTSTRAAIELLAELGDDAVIYSGGTELLLVMKLGLADFDHLVDIKRIPGLDAITVDNNVLRIGAAATHRSIETNQDIGMGWPSLGLMTRQVANVRVRNVGTLGGNLAFGDPASDPATFLMALEASIEVRSVDGLLRSVPVGEFHVGAYQTALADAELIESIVVPGVDGYFGVLYNHAPLLSTLGSGELKVTDKDGTTKHWQVEGGFVEVLRNRVSVLTTKIEEVEKKPTGWG